tara:strand:- start:63 stop:218 length:156 start_codon:yes stop_codon:yes gene_type:complete
VVIQSHLKKLFAGIHRVEFSEGNAAITAMLSLDGEKVRPYPHTPHPNPRRR